MRIRNNAGPMSLPWTTPLSKLDSVDRASPTLVWCERPWKNWRNWRIHWKPLPRIPYWTGPALLTSLYLL